MIEPELVAIVRKHNRETKAELLKMAQKYNVEESGELQEQLQERVYQNGSKLIAEIEMHIQGRFIDMQVGRGYPAGSAQQNRTLLTGRPHKPWYSKTYYGRLHRLYSLASFSVVEQIMRQNKTLN